MLEYKSIQSTAVATIAAATYFTGELVEADRGKSLATIGNALTPPVDETATAARGFAVVVSMPVACEIERQVAGVALVYAKFSVMVLVNPDVNDADTGAQKDLLEAVQESCAALTSYSDDTGDHFEIDEPPSLLTTEDGYLGYETIIRKLVALS